MLRTAALTCAALALSLCAHADESGPAKTKPTLTLTIKAAKAKVKAGDWPAMSITITNKGAEAVSLPLPGDGSSSGWRPPVVGWSVLPKTSKEAHAKTPPPFKGGRCGNINAIKPTDLVELKPGASKTYKPGWFGGPQFDKPGTYRVVLLYQHDPKLPVRGLAMGTHDPETLAAIRACPARTLRSNEITITVE